MRNVRSRFTFSNAALAEESGIADGMTRRFDFTVLQSMAHDLSRQPWGGAPRDLPPTLANLTPQAYNSIQYDADIRCGITLTTASWTSSSSTSGWVFAAACACSRWIRKPSRRGRSTSARAV
jgi:hypothetical protein